EYWPGCTKLFALSVRSPPRAPSRVPPTSATERASRSSARQRATRDGLLAALTVARPTRPLRGARDARGRLGDMRGDGPHLGRSLSYGRMQECVGSRWRTSAE